MLFLLFSKVKKQTPYWIEIGGHFSNLKKEENYSHLVQFLIYVKGNKAFKSHNLSVRFQSH